MVARCTTDRLRRSHERSLPVVLGEPGDGRRQLRGRSRSMPQQTTVEHDQLEFKHDA